MAKIVTNYTLTGPQLEAAVEAWVEDTYPDELGVEDTVYTLGGTRIYDLEMRETLGGIEIYFSVEAEFEHECGKFVSNDELREELDDYIGTYAELSELSGWEVDAQ